jgi:hypothetical protein
VFHLGCQQNNDDVLFYADNIKLFLPVKGFQNCMKIQSDLNKLSEWCERNALFLNVDKCKTITFSRTHFPGEFAYMLAGTVLDRVSSISNLGVIHRREDEFFGACKRLVRPLRCWDLSEDCHSSSEIHIL